MHTAETAQRLRYLHRPCCYADRCSSSSSSGGSSGGSSSRAAAFGPLYQLCAVALERGIGTCDGNAERTASAAFIRDSRLNGIERAAGQPCCHMLG
jgi:hypothetical protein